MGSDEATAIANELHRCAGLVDAGRFEEVERCFLVDLVGDLSRHLRFDPPGWPRPEQAPCNLTLLKFAGGGLWSSGEDIYNAARFGELVGACLGHKKKLAAGAAEAAGE